MRLAEGTLSSGPTSFRGVVRGRVIELDHEPGLPDGQAVRVTLRTDDLVPDASPGEGLRRAFGAWGDDAEGVDRFLAWNHDQRKRDRRGTTG